MTETAGLYAALAAAQGEYPEVPKKRTATVRGNKDGKSFNYSYKYADLSDIMTAIRPVLARNGLSVTQPLVTGDDGKIRLRSVLAHQSGETVESVMPLGPFPSEGKAVQTWAGVLTYARRYALTALVGLAVEDDDDANRAAGHDDYDVGDRDPAPRPPRPPQAKPNGTNGHANGYIRTPVEEAEDALAAADPWKLDGLPIEEFKGTLLAGIGARPFDDARAAVAAYGPKLEGRLTKPERDEVRAAWLARKDAWKAENVTAAG